MGEAVDGDFLGGGWNYWMGCAPDSSNAVIEIYRDGWDQPFIRRLDQIHPATNVYGLYWRQA